MTNRKTSTYTVSVVVEGDPHAACDEMKKRCPVPLAASGVEGNVASVRFRASSDDEARLRAVALWSGVYRIFTGYGVNLREVPVTT